METSESITRKSASNLALAFILLPKEKRGAMAGLYAFCREVDDVADEESRPTNERRLALQQWREDIRRACTGGQTGFAVNRELQPVIARYHLPFRLFDELIQGVEMDLDINRYDTLEELETYCYRVASVVGLLSIEIFGYNDPRCRDYAIFLGKALQLTNILRDVRVDAEKGRIYLPLTKLRQFNVSEAEILNLEYSERFENLASDIAQLARSYYSRAREILPASERRSMIAAELMGSVYWRLLEKLEKRRFNVFGKQPTRLNKVQKIFLVLRTWYRLSSGALAANYGGAN